MAEAAFTPGPWRVSPLGNCDVDAEDGKLEIATTHQDILNGGYRDPSTAQADARLIAAAPELYEALNNLTRLARSLADAPDGRMERRKGCRRSRAREGVSMTARHTQATPESGLDTSASIAPPCDALTGDNAPALEAGRSELFRSGHRYFTMESVPRSVRVVGRCAVDPDVFVCEPEGMKTSLLMNCGSRFDGRIIGTEIFLDPKTGVMVGGQLNQHTRLDPITEIRLRRELRLAELWANGAVAPPRHSAKPEPQSSFRLRLTASVAFAVAVFCIVYFGGQLVRGWLA